MKGYNTVSRESFFLTNITIQVFLARYRPMYSCIRAKCLTQSHPEKSTSDCEFHLRLKMKIDLLVCFLVEVAEVCGGGKCH